jgi:hypothetical protein
MVGNIYITGGGQWENTSVAASGTPKIYTDYNVGIGTDAPSSTLQVGLNPNSGTGAGVAAGSNGALKVARASDADQLIEGYKVGTSSPNFVVRADGNLKLGTAESLEMRPGTITSNVIDFVAYNYSSSSYITVKNIASEWRWHDGDNGERMRITSAGNVGINETSPSAKLQVLGGNGNQLWLDNGGERFTQISLQHSGTQNGALWLDDTDSMVDLYANTGHGIRFKTGGSTERVRITSAGLVGVNCTPLTQFQVKGGTNANIALTVMSSEAAIEAYNDAGSANVPLRIRGTDIKFFSGSTETLRLTSDGAIALGPPGSMGSSYARLSIDCHGRDVLTDVTDVTNYGLAFHNDPNTNDANGIGFFNDDGTTCGGYILHQDKGSSNLGDLVFGTAPTANAPVERLRITSDGSIITPYSTTAKVAINYSGSIMPSQNLYVQGDFYAREIQTAYKTRLTGSLIMDGYNDGQNIALGGVKGIDIRMFGMYWRYSAQPFADWTPNFQHNQSDIDSTLGVGDVFTATIIVKQRSAGTPNGVTVSGVQVDGTSTGVDLDWVGGSAPGASPGSGWDVWTFVVMKTSSTPTYHVLGKRETYS